jgi:hypothetical protein
MWPVVHQQLGIRPDLGRGQLEVVPQVPPYEPSLTGQNIRLGTGALAKVTASRAGNAYRTEIDTGNAPVSRLVLGQTLPHGTQPGLVLLDGKPHDPQVRETNRGVEVTVKTGPGAHVLVVQAG